MIPLEAAIAKFKLKRKTFSFSIFSSLKKTNGIKSRSASNGMKQKAFGFIAIFLVIFQLFSPFIINFSDNKISIEANIANAVTAQSRGGNNACSIDAVTSDKAFVTIGLAPGVEATAVNIAYKNSNISTKSTLGHTNKSTLFYAIKRSDQQTNGPYYLSTYILDLNQNPMTMGSGIDKVYCNITTKNSNSAYTSDGFKVPTDFTQYESINHQYKDPNTGTTTSIQAKGLNPEALNVNAIQFAPFAVNVIKSRENGKNTFQIAYLFISQKRAMADADNIFMNRELESTIYGGNSMDEIDSSEVSAGNVTYYSRYDSQIPGLDGYYEWIFVDKNKIIDEDNNINYSLTSSVSSSLSFAGSMGIAMSSTFGAVNPIASSLVGIGTYFFSSKTTRTFNTIGFQYSGTDNGMHFSGIVRDIFAEIKDLQQLAGGEDERFSFGIDKQKSAEGNNGIGIVIALEYGSNDYEEVITPRSYPKRTSPSAAEVTESQVFDNYYDTDLLSGDAGKSPILNGDINREWEGFALVLTKNSRPSGSVDSIPTGSKVMNLNPYLIGDLSNESSFIVSNYKNEINAEGKRVYPYYDQRKIYLVAEVNKNIFGDNETLKEGDTLYAYVISEEDSTNDEGSRLASGIVEFKITSQINQTGRTYGTVTDISQNEIDEDNMWLPVCDSKPLSWVTGCLVRAFYYIIYVPSAGLLAIAGSIMDFVLAYSIQPDSYNAQYIKDGWRFIRDVCNLFFIFMLLYLAFKLVLNIGQGTKQLIVNTLIVATVINFSYPLTTVVIDVSNITARQLYYNVFSRTDGEDGKAISLSATAAEGYDPQRIILDGVRKNSKTFSADSNPGTIFMILLMGVIFNVIAILIFLKIALQFIYRIIGLIFAIILSPLAVFSFSLSSGQRSSMKMVGFEQWFSGLLKDAFKAPIFLFLMMILVLFVKNNPFSAVFGDGVIGIEWWMSLIIPFMLIIGFLYLIKSMTEDLTSSIAKLAGDKLISVASGVAGFGAAIATGGAAWAGRNVLGKRANRYMQSTAGEKLMTKAAEGNTWARLKVGALDMTRKGSFDLRQNKAANAVSGFTGVNMQAGTNYLPFFGKQFQTATSAGGYMAQVQRKTDRIKKFEDSLGFDQEMYNKMEDVKQKAERAANNQEDEVNKLREEEQDALATMNKERAEGTAKGVKYKNTKEEIKEKETEYEKIKQNAENEKNSVQKADLLAQAAILEKDIEEKKKEAAKYKKEQEDANERETKAGEAREKIRDRITQEKDKLDALKGDGYTYTDETGKAVHVLGVKGAEKAMEKVKTDRVDRYKQFQREKSGKIFKRKTGLDVYKEKIEKDLKDIETDEDKAKRSDMVEIMNEVTAKAKTDKEWDDTNEDKKKELIKKYKKDAEILNKHAKKRIYEAVYNSIDIDSMEGEAKDKALKDVAEAARDIENMTYQLKSSPSGTRSKLGAVLNDSFLHTDVAKGSVIGAPFGWMAAPTAIATGLVRMAEYDRKFYENYGRSWQDKDTKVDTTDKYQPPKS